MSSTLALKSRIHSLKVPETSSFPSMNSSIRKISIGLEADLFAPSEQQKNLTFPLKKRTKRSKKQQQQQQDDQDEDAVQMLLSMSHIVQNEIKDDSSFFEESDDEEEEESQVQLGPWRTISTSPPRLSFSKNKVLTLASSSSSPTTTSSSRKTKARSRAVSIDASSSPLHNTITSDLTTAKGSVPSLVSPGGGNTPKSSRRGRPIRTPQRLHKNSSAAVLKKLTVPKLSSSSAAAIHNHVHDIKEHKQQAIQASVAKGVSLKRIMRKKFSWKNYPELEAFLVANREEYLRHSALNYTLQQKQYNNKLTERLLELAAEHGYIFDEKEFNFVTVRDRIRCYFKSYVQSAKKRGVIIGYAARKAGLLSEEELQESAEHEAEIVIPVESL